MKRSITERSSPPDGERSTKIITENIPSSSHHPNRDRALLFSSTTSEQFQTQVAQDAARIAEMAPPSSSSENPSSLTFLNATPDIYTNPKAKKRYKRTTKQAESKQSIQKARGARTDETGLRYDQMTDEQKRAFDKQSIQKAAGARTDETGLKYDQMTDEQKRAFDKIQGKKARGAMTDETGLRYDQMTDEQKRAFDKIQGENLQLGKLSKRYLNLEDTV